MNYFRPRMEYQNGKVTGKKKASVAVMMPMKIKTWKNPPLLMKDAGAGAAKGSQPAHDAEQIDTGEVMFFKHLFLSMFHYS